MAWAPAGIGKGHSPRKYCKVLFVLQTLSKLSLNEVFMHYFEKMSSPSGIFALRLSPGLCPWTPLGDLRLSDPLIAPLEKKILRASMGRGVDLSNVGLRGRVKQKFTFNLHDLASRIGEYRIHVYTASVTDVYLKSHLS